MHVLVVDDSAFARERVARVLREAGHTVVEAASGPAALAILAEASPDLITVDLLMPEMDGIELLQRLRGLHVAAPIVAISADIQQATREEALAAGASAFVSKTDLATELLPTLQIITGRLAPLALSPQQEDAFTEMINLAMGRAANALSVLLERRVSLKAPRVQIMHAAELSRFFDGQTPHVGAAITQKFSGRLNGLSGLIFPQHAAVILIRVLLNATHELNQLSSTEQTVLAEVGNVVLNAALARLGDQVAARLRIGLPAVYLNQTGAAVARLLLNAAPGADQAVVLLSRLTIGDADMTTYLVIVLPQADVEQLLKSLQVD